MKTEKIGVVVIYKEDQVVGIIHRDEKTGHKILYSCVPMDEDEIADSIEGNIEEKI